MHPETRFCSACGHAVDYRIPDGDHVPRHICPQCGHIQYHNPKIIVGVIPEWEDGRVLMCRRDIEPRRGLWTFPSGFMEMGETSAAGAAREAREESLAEVEVGSLLMVVNVPYVAQVTLVHRGRLLAPHFGPTPESSEVVLMAEDAIPWDDIAFPTIKEGLRHFFECRRNGEFSVREFDILWKPRPPERPEVPAGEPES